MRRICPYALPNHPSPRNNATTALVRSDSLAEGSEFELTVPVSKPSDNSIRLEFAAARRIALVARPRIGPWRCSFCAAFGGISERLSLAGHSS
jgi:hypothetical protein